MDRLSKVRQEGHHFNVVNMPKLTPIEALVQLRNLHHMTGGTTLFADIADALEADVRRIPDLEQKLSRARDYISNNATEPVHDLLRYLGGI